MSAVIGHRYIGWMLGAVVLAAAPASAGVRYTVETVTTYEDEEFQRVEDVLLDGNRARIDVRYGKRGQMQPEGYLLTTDGGKTWTVVEGPDAVCGTWDMAAYYRTAGSLIHTVERWFNVTVSQASTKVVSRESGPKILGFDTTHVRLVSKLKAEARLLFISRELELEITDDVWFAPKLDVEPVQQRWLDAMRKTGYERLDRMTSTALDAIDGTVLKQKTVAVVRDPRKKSERVKADEINVTTFEHVEPGAGSRRLQHVPGCQSVSDEKMKDAAKDLLQSLVKP